MITAKEASIIMASAREHQIENLIKDFNSKIEDNCRHGFNAALVTISPFYSDLVCEMVLASFEDRGFKILKTKAERTFIIKWYID